MRLKLLALLFVFFLFPSMVLADIMTVSFSGTEMRSAPNAMSSKVIVIVDAGGGRGPLPALGHSTASLGT